MIISDLAGSTWYNFIKNIFTNDPHNTFIAIMVEKTLRKEKWLISVIGSHNDCSRWCVRVIKEPLILLLLHQKPTVSENTDL